jgi:Zn-dependent M28 family amino/carboxypeptidase
MINEEFLRDTVSSARIGSQVQALEGVRHPVAAPEALQLTADYLRDSLGNLGYQMSEHLFEDNGSTFRNVIASRAGLVHPGERVAVLAHYDTVAGTPGADDNASGVAVLLEMARALSQLSFERTVQFIGVCLEENQREDDHDSGTRGSGALARHAREEGWDLRAVVVLESVGYAGDEVVQSLPPGIPVPVPEVGNFIAVVGNERSGEISQAIVRSIEQHRVALPHVVLTVPGNGELLPDSRRSDHAPFWDQGFPAIMLTDTTNFRNPHYHQPTDTLATLNLEFAAKVCRCACGAIFELARLTEVA